MKRKTKIILSALSILLVSVALISINYMVKDPAVKDEGNTITYNGITYSQVPYDHQFSNNFELSPTDRIDLKQVRTEKRHTYIDGNTYFIYRGDNAENPKVIYKENKFFGVSGWLYIGDISHYADLSVDKDKIIEFNVGCQEYWSTNDAEVIETLKNAIVNKEDLAPIIAKYTDIEWSILYVKYENSPFTQRIGYIENGKFIYL